MSLTCSCVPMHIGGIIPVITRDLTTKDNAIELASNRNLMKRDKVVWFATMFGHTKLLFLPQNS